MDGMVDTFDPIALPDERRAKRRRKRHKRLPVPREVIPVTLTDMAHRGYALGRHDGRVVLAAYGLAGEDVMVEITERRDDYIIGRVVEVLTPSPARVDAPCPYYGTCGGCQWQHIEYAEQLRLKEHIVREQMRRIGRLPDVPVLPTVSADPPWHYRNQVRFTAWHGQLGFVGQSTRRFVRIDHCLISHPRINELLPQLQDELPGARQVMVRVGANSGDILIQPPLDRYNPDLPVESGQREYIEVLADEEFSIAASSFFQVNTAQAEMLVRLVREALALGPDDLLLDAYAGVGTFAKALASSVRHVVAIEESASAVDDARRNLAGVSNVTIELGSVEHVLPVLPFRPDAVILDPPRQGCARAVLDALIEAKPERIAYVSCDPATLARDLALLVEGGYEMASVQPVDMFPQTYHIECVTTLRLADSK
jgi:23S rRNA (uracil1939-C5)-methyltransferase